MTVKNFIINSDLRNIPLNSDWHIPEKINLLFENNRDSILKDFFREVFEKLNREEYENISENLILLVLSPFKVNDAVNLLEILKRINFNFKNNPQKITSELLDFEWCLLDHILHEWLI